jgi:NAD(P)-dependent dehydrogenase (short-subunit alcohol dehydrogenase family)
MAGRLDGKVAWISGGGSGMGEAAAKLFAREGCKVGIIDIDEKHGKRVADEITKSGGHALFVRTDVGKEEPVRESIEKTVAKFGSLQIVINCAGIAHAKKLHEYSVAEWDLLMDVNLKSIFLATKHAMPHLRKNPRSYMVNIGSISSFVAQSSTPAYTASKGGVLQLSNSIAVDYAVDGLRCNCICPGITDTPLLRYHLSKLPDPEHALENRLRRVPMGVKLIPEDIAKAILYFSTEDSAGITGTSLVIDCGYITVAEWDTSTPTKFMTEKE